MNADRFFVGDTGYFLKSLGKMSVIYTGNIGTQTTPQHLFLLLLIASSQIRKAINRLSVTTNINFSMRVPILI